MNYSQEIPNSKPIKNKNNYSTSTIVFLLESNNKRIFLPRALTQIIGFKVKSLCWSVTPFDFASATMCYLASDDLVENTINQSMGVIPNGGRYDVYPNSIIGTWVLDKLPVITSPNSTLPNFEQPIIWLSRPMRITDLSFTIAANTVGPISFDFNNLIFLTMEFYYYQRTSECCGRK